MKTLAIRWTTALLALGLMCVTAMALSPSLSVDADGTVSAAADEGNLLYLASFDPTTGRFEGSLASADAVGGENLALKAIQTDGDRAPQSESKAVLVVAEADSSITGGAYDGVVVTASAGGSIRLTDVSIAGDVTLYAGESLVLDGCDVERVVVNTDALSITTEHMADVPPIDTELDEAVTVTVNGAERTVSQPITLSAPVLMTDGSKVWVEASASHLPADAWIEVWMSSVPDAPALVIRKGAQYFSYADGILRCYLDPLVTWNRFSNDAFALSVRDTDIKTEYTEKTLTSGTSAASDDTLAVYKLSDDSLRAAKADGSALADSGIYRCKVFSSNSITSGELYYKSGAEDGIVFKDYNNYMSFAATAVVTRAVPTDGADTITLDSYVYPAAEILPETESHARLVQDGAFIRAYCNGYNFYKYVYVVRDSENNIVLSGMTNKGSNVIIDMMLSCPFPDEGTQKYSLTFYGADSMGSYDADAPIATLSKCFEITVSDEIPAYGLSLEPGAGKYTITMTEDTTTWYQYACRWTRSDGWIRGMSSGTFKGSKTLSRKFEEGDVLDVRFLSGYELDGQTVKVTMSPPSRTVYTKTKRVPVPDTMKLDVSDGGVYLRLAWPAGADKTLIKDQLVSLLYEINESQSYTRTLNASTVSTGFLSSDSLSEGENTIKITLAAEPSDAAATAGYQAATKACTYQVAYHEESAAYDGAADVAISFEPSPTEENLWYLHAKGLKPDTDYEVSLNYVNSSSTISSQEKSFHTDENGCVTGDAYRAYNIPSFTDCTVSEQNVEVRGDYSVSIGTVRYTGTFGVTIGSQQEADQKNGFDIEFAINANRQLPAAIVAPAGRVRDESDNYIYYTFYFYNKGDSSVKRFTFTNCAASGYGFILPFSTGTYTDVRLYLSAEGTEYDKLTPVAGWTLDKPIVASSNIEEFPFPDATVTVAADTDPNNEGQYIYTFNGLDFSAYSYTMNNPTLHQSLIVTYSPMRFANKNAVGNWIGEGMLLTAKTARLEDGIYYVTTTKSITVDVTE